MSRDSQTTLDVGTDTMIKMSECQINQLEEEGATQTFLSFEIDQMRNWVSHLKKLGEC
jgi:hypothetical protein